MTWANVLLFFGGLTIGYVAGAIRIAKRLNPLIPTEVCEPFTPQCEETSVQTLKRASEALQSQAASLRGVTK